jgi:hypothetical protein
MELEQKPLTEEEKDLIINWFIQKEGQQGINQINTCRLRNKLDKSPKTCRELIESNIKANSYKIDSLSFYMLLMAHI